MINELSLHMVMSGELWESGFLVDFYTYIIHMI